MAKPKPALHASDIAVLSERIAAAVTQSVPGTVSYADAVALAAADAIRKYLADEPAALDRD